MTNWTTIKEYTEILFTFHEGIAKISINRPQVHNAFTPQTVKEMIDAMNICREDTSIGVIILTGEGGKAFCSGGDQSQSLTNYPLKFSNLKRAYYLHSEI